MVAKGLRLLCSQPLGNQMVAATPCTLPPTGGRLLYIFIVLCVLVSYSASFVIKVQFWITSPIIHYLLLQMDGSIKNALDFNC